MYIIKLRNGNENLRDFKTFRFFFNEKWNSAAIFIFFFSHKSYLIKKKEKKKEKEETIVLLARLMVWEIGSTCMCKIHFFVFI